ncbi:MAG: hypothetical protein SF162_05865 [bacterium]|nr:hypothetical protein [bacterium]
MNNDTLVILGICGFLTVCFGLLVLAFVTIFRYTGRNFLGFLGLLTKNNDEQKDETNTYVGRRPNLRHIVEQSDFDAALAKHIVTDSQQVGTTAAPLPTAQAAPPPPQPGGFNAPLPGAPKPPTVLPGFIPGTATAPPNAAPAPNPGPPPAINPPARPAGVPPTGSAASDLGWENPALRPRDFGAARKRSTNDDDDNDLIGGLMPDGDDAGLL